MPSRNSFTNRLASTSSCHHRPRPPMPLISPVPLSMMTDAFPPGTSNRFCRVAMPCGPGMEGLTRYTGIPRLVATALFSGRNFCPFSVILTSLFWSVTTSTLALFDQICNAFLTVENHKLSVHDQKLSVAIQINQDVTLFLFLILKRSLKTPPPSAPKTLAMAAEESVAENKQTNVHSYS